MSGSRRCGEAGRGATALPIAPSSATRLGTSIVGLSGYPPRKLGWKQYRALGASALDLCAVACGRLDAYVDCSRNAHGPWDYLGGMLVCREAGRRGRRCVRSRPRRLEHAARRTPVAAASQILLGELVAARRSFRVSRLVGSTSLIDRIHALLLRVYRRLPRRARIAVVHTIAPDVHRRGHVRHRAAGRRAAPRPPLVPPAMGRPGRPAQPGRGARDRRAAGGARGGRRSTSRRSASRRSSSTRVPGGSTSIYRARLVNGSIPTPCRPTSVEILEARWFPADELPELQHETAGALVALARARDPINPTGEQEP